VDLWAEPVVDPGAESAVELGVAPVLNLEFGSPVDLGIEPELEFGIAVDLEVELGSQPCRRPGQM
jgi:hypothetical protein